MLFTLVDITDLNCKSQKDIKNLSNNTLENLWKSTGFSRTKYVNPVLVVQRLPWPGGGLHRTYPASRPCAGSYSPSSQDSAPSVVSDATPSSSLLASASASVGSSSRWHSSPRVPRGRSHQAPLKIHHCCQKIFNVSYTQTYFGCALRKLIQLTQNNLYLLISS